MSVRPPPGFHSYETKIERRSLSSQIGEYIVSYIKQLENRVIELEAVQRKSNGPNPDLNFGNEDPNELGRLLRIAGIEE